ncbi:hypothetical protein Pelo_3910 [Pelomyxa schiedti]|nr:hypothetical protein Pelo_3910 [Pelomyxa schiedti]
MLGRSRGDTFVGVAKLKELQQQQLYQFEIWARSRSWDSFHRSHYDWWAFPIDEKSSYGFSYTITPEVRTQLANDPEFCSNLSRLAALLLLSWGWDTSTGAPVPSPERSQSWHSWPVRLYKCGRALKIFGLQAQFDAVKEYAVWLRAHGESLSYSSSATNNMEDVIVHWEATNTQF